MPFLRRVLPAPPGAASMLVIVLVASMAVAAVLAYHAITSARQRRAVSESMLRQYAQLALWEYSRQARRDVDEALMHALATYAHPERQTHTAGGSCDCARLNAVEQWFEVLPGGEIRSRSGEVDARLRNDLARISVREGREGVEGAVQISPLQGSPTHLVATKWEPHLGASGGQVGLVTSVAALVPVLARSYERTALLPATLAGGRDVRTLVDLRITDSAGTAVFASRDTARGPSVVESAFLPELPLGLAAQSSLTRSFVDALGPEHGAGPSGALLVALVGLNALLLGAGLWQLARERELARLRADFVAGVSHELRTPLAQIRMFSETLLLDRVRTGSEKRRALEIIGRESQRLSQLVDNVLLFHRQHRAGDADAGTLIDLPAFVQEVVDSFQPLTVSKRVQIAITNDSSDLTVRADAGALRQVLLNLLDNAVKFGPAGQALTIDLRGSANQAVLSLQDQGQGVPAAERERIFDAFARGRQTRGTGGAGIGLAVVRQIVTAHGGTIAVDDAPGGGARFAVSLPAVRTGDHVDSAAGVAG